MRHSLKTGFSFGLTSGTITTLGLIVGLYAGTHSKIAVIGGILTIAIADAFSDALGIHVSEESEDRYSEKEIWESTISTFLSKLFFASTFVIPILLLPMTTAIVVSVIWGLSLLSAFSFYLAREQKKNPRKVVMEHLVTGLIVVLIAHFVGAWIASVFS